MNHILKRFVITAKSYTTYRRLAGAPASISLDKILDCAERVKKTVHPEKQKNEALKLIYAFYERVQQRVSKMSTDESWNNAKFSNDKKLYVGEPVIFYGDNCEYVSEKYRSRDNDEDIIITKVSAPIRYDEG